MKDWLEMSRREFLAALGTAYGTAACAWAAPRSWFIDYASGEGRPPAERFVNALCPMCPGGCGLTARVVHGCAVGVRGSKSHPINRGGLCSRASAVLQDLYNPDRLQRPLRSAGARGSGQWEPIEWDAAIGMVAEKLHAIREQAGPQGLCVVLGRDRGVIRSAWQRFVRAYGSPNLVDAFPDDNLAALPAVLATHGTRQRIGYDIAAASYVLSFASQWLDAHWSTEQAARAFAEFRRGRPGFRPRWVHVEPRYSLTAVKSDEWLQIRPGTEGTLALGIAHVIIREGLYDREFIQRHGHGFDDWTDDAGSSHLGFRQLVLRDYAPARVQALTGVPEGDVFRLGREFGMNRPAIALGFDGGDCGTQATYDRMAIHCLNALVGSIDRPGGITVFQELTLLNSDVDIDDVATRGLAHPRLDDSLAQRRLSDNAVDLLAESISTGRPYPTEALFLVEADPIFSLSEGARFEAALAEVPLVVAFSGYHNDSSRQADLILPSPHGLHRWDFNVAHTLKGHPVVTVAHPVLPPLPGMRDPYDVVLGLAQRIGGSVAAALPWSNSEQVVDAVCRELFDKGEGAAFGPANEEDWAQLLESRGWRAPFAENYEAFKKDILTGGGWTDPIYFHGEWDRVFRSPARRFAFSSAYLARSFETTPDPSGSSDPDVDRRCLPDCGAEERKHDETYPLDLYVYALPNLVAVSSPNLPWLNDIAGAYMFEKWRTWVEINPQTAEHHSIAEGDQVVVRTPRGRLTLPAKISPGVMPEVIAIPFGFGRKSGGRWCANVGENPSALVVARTDPLTGRALWSSTRGSISKA
ncbi:MAG: molybdopterin-containing oxidoreductase family protein [Planctomycetota bacterium]|jgi:anaerobic selenocysteine-containing dehydrogenase